jgi:ubiquinone/menaquinone biosynthesis C-methylase UbiE
MCECMHFRRRYYNWFSTFYDRFVRLHSGDRQESMRDFLVETADLRNDSTLLDLCTGTGATALRAVSSGIRVIGIDFSEGMLQKAARKSKGRPAPFWIHADVCALPVRSSSIDRATCSYAMYELSGIVRSDLLREVVRILKPGGMFLMMEHLPPRQLFLRLLYFIRIYLLGSRDVRGFAGSEEKDLCRFLVRVGTAISPGGKTTVVFGYKE